MLSRLKLEEGWTTLFLVWALIATAAAALISAEYMNGLEVLLLVGTFGVLAGLLLAKSNFSSTTAHLFALFYGIALVALLIGQTLPGDLTWRERILDLFQRQVDWIGKAFSGGTSRDGLIFILQTSGIFWLLAYTASWYTFRKPRVWRVVLPTGIVLLSVVYYYYGPKPLGLFLAIYALLGLLYVARTHLVAQEKTWRSEAVRYERTGIRFGFLRASFLVAVIALVVAWSTPALGANSSLGDALYGVSQPWRQVQDDWTRLFSSLRSYGTGTNDPYQDTLVLGGPRSVGNDPIMDIFVSEPVPYVYWHAVALDTYEDGGWSVAERESVLHIPDDGVINDGFAASRRVITQTVRNYLNNSSTIYGAPALVGSDQQVFVDHATDDQGSLVVQGLRARFVLRAGDRYNVISEISTADEASLRAAPTDYPDWVEDIYLQVPDSITPETKELAAEIMEPYDNVYDQAWAVQEWMRSNISYNDQIDAPPADIEPVHYTLFVSQEAYCTYYASAMTIMLRSQGVPARIVNGYAQGDFVEDANAYRVRANNAHTWVEVYFPQYGWIQFEPTASIPVVVRPETGDSETIEPLGDGTSQSFLDREELLGEDLDDPGAEDSELPELPEEENAGTAALTPEEQRAWILRGGAGLIIVGVAGVFMFAGSRYNQRVEGSIDGSYGRLESWARWLGLGFRPVETPYERADKLTSAVPKGKQPIRNLTQHYVISKFSSRPESTNGYDPREEWRKLRPVLLRESVRRRFQRMRNRDQQDNK
jgi:hypothetical protein